MDFIKTKSSYVKRKKHSETKDGTIFERDITTLGGLNLLSPNQTSIYTSGNFIISVDNTNPVKRKIKKNTWVTNTEGDNDIWTLDNISNLIASSSDTTSNDGNITFNKDYYRLQDFSYYGSLSKMIESSLNNIINNFPGELYSPFLENNTNEGSKVIFTSNFNGYAEYILGLHDYSGNTSESRDFIYLILNPFNINLHTSNQTANVENLNKYFFYENNKDNYQLITSEGVYYDICDLTIDCINSEVIEELLEDDEKNKKICPGSFLKQIDFKENDNIIFSLRVYLGNNDKIYYLTKQEYLNYHVRPKKEIYDDFYNNLNIFEKYILTKKESTTSNESYYISTFEFSKITDEGLLTTLEDFVIPIARGNYNIDIDSPSFGRTIGKFSKIASDYDDMFCDNLYRSMTHESIKNFDWTHIENEETQEIYTEGANKISNIIRLFGREFDELKSYIDNIVYVNKLSYDNKNNLSDYFLTDVADLKGWDLYNITPYTLTEYIIDNNNKVYSSYSINYNTNPNVATYNNKSGYTVTRNFSQDNTLTIIPYNVNDSIPFGYFKYCNCDGKLKLSPSEDSFNKLLHTDCLTFRRILPYYSKEEYTYKDVYSEFLRRLCLNTPSIFKHKGTIEGIEEILAMFGLKSKRWINSLTKTPQCKIECDNGLNEANYYLPDYEIIEYTCFANGIYDSYNQEKEATWINWFNSTKLISYDYNNNYEGLPVRSYDANNENDKILYPYFGNAIDGDPYYQMNGGWLEYSDFNFDKDNKIVIENNEEIDISDTKLFTETYSYFRAIDNITSIKDLKSSEMHEGDIMYVENMKDDYLVIDGFDFYKIETDTLLLNDEYVNYKYFTINVSPINTQIGDITLSNVLYVSNPLYETDNTIQTINIENLNNNIDVKVYICDEDTWNNTISGLNENLTTVSGFGFILKDDYSEILDRHISYFVNTSLNTNKTNYRFINFTEEDYSQINVDFTEYENGIYTNYFILHDSENCNYYSKKYAWEQLEENDKRYLKINTIIEKNKGNNPHIGHAKYDEGYEYIDYFNFLFKYALENSLFNEDCYYSSDYETNLDIISQIGFSKIVKEPALSGNTSKIGYYQYQDSKVHSFCDIIENSFNSSNIDYPLEYNFRNVIGNIGKDITYKKYGIDYKLTDINRIENDYNLKYGKDDNGKQIEKINPIYNSANNIIISGIDTTNITDQIINTKRVDIIFNLHVREESKFSQKGLEEKKYITSIIMPYLEQMLPSNIIFKIGYKYLPKGDPEYIYYKLINVEHVEDKPWDTTSADIQYSIQEYYHYKEGYEEKGNIIYRSKTVNFEKNTLWSDAPRNGSFNDEIYDNINVNWSLKLLAKPSITISIVSGGKDNEILELAINSSHTVTGKVVYSCKSDPRYILEDNKVMFVSHYDEDITISAKTDNASNIRTIPISCGVEPVQSFTLKEVIIPSKQEWHITSTTINYILNVIETEHSGEQKIVNTITRHQIVTFNQNKEIPLTSLIRNGVFDDVEYGITDIQWSLEQNPIIYEYIDLGLPSNILWGKTNLWDTINNYGNTFETSYYQWGDIKGYTDYSHSYWNTTPFNGGRKTYSQDYWEEHSGDYVSSDGTLFQNVDAAYIGTDKIAHMPSVDDINELLYYTTTSKTANNKGVIFTSKKNGNSIIMPTYGYISEGAKSKEDNIFIWSNKLNETEQSQSLCFNTYNDKENLDNYQRSYAMSVRMVSGTEKEYSITYNVTDVKSGETVWSSTTYNIEFTITRYDERPWVADEYIKCYKEVKFEENNSNDYMMRDGKFDYTYNGQTFKDILWQVLQSPILIKSVSAIYINPSTPILDYGKTSATISVRVITAAIWEADSKGYSRSGYTNCANEEYKVDFNTINETSEDIIVSGEAEPHTYYHYYSYGKTKEIPYSNKLKYTCHLLPQNPTYGSVIFSDDTTAETAYTNIKIANKDNTNTNVKRPTKVKLTEGIRGLNSFCQNGVLNTIKEITFPNKDFYSIENDTFAGNEDLTRITLPSTLTYINSLRNHVTSATFTLSFENEASENDKYHISGNTITERATNALICAYPNSDLRNLNLFYLSGFANGHWKKATVDETNIGNTVKVIGNYAFTYNTSITSVTLGDNISFIDDAAFSRCNNIESVTIGSNIVKIGTYALACADFKYSSLKKIVIKSIKCPILGNNIFKCDDGTGVKINNNSNCYFYYPKGSNYNDFKTNTNNAISGWTFIQFEENSDGTTTYYKEDGKTQCDEKGKEITV